MDEALKAAELEVVTLDWDGFAAGTTIFTTIFLTEAWDTGHALAHAHPDGTGDDIRQMLSMADLFRPGLGDARGQLAAWRQSLLDLFGQLDLLALPGNALAFPPALADLAPDLLVDVIIQITLYTGLFNAAGTPCTAQPIPAAGTPIPASLQLGAPRWARNCCSPPHARWKPPSGRRRLQAGQGSRAAPPPDRPAGTARDAARQAAQPERRGSRWPRPARRARIWLRR